MIATDALRLERALLSLEGLSVGDAFGQSFFSVPTSVLDSRLEERHEPPPPWFYTDDTIMAQSIVCCLATDGQIVEDHLARAFASEYTRQPFREYGGTAHGILRAIAEGKPWTKAASEVFDGEGSCGNGGAMRAGPIGAYFSDDLPALLRNAHASAAVTHAHPDGQTGALAVALAASWTSKRTSGSAVGHNMIDFVLSHLPQTDTYWSLRRATKVALEHSPSTAARMLGNGSEVLASDTVAFCLWCASRHPDDFETALWSTVSGLGDMDTTCAIVGSLVVLSAGLEGIPHSWLQAREPLGVTIEELSR